MTNILPGIPAEVFETALETIEKACFIKYGGLTWERTAAGFVHNGILCRDHSEMDLLVLHEREALAKSINKQL